MKALTYHGARDIRHEAMDDPRLESDRDAIVQMTGCSICGSDLHIYHGHGFSEDIGFCVGHEAVGEVVEVGRAVSRVKVGDLVMLPAAVGCGACRSCLAGNVDPLRIQRGRLLRPLRQAARRAERSFPRARCGHERGARFPTGSARIRP